MRKKEYNFKTADKIVDDEFKARQDRKDSEVEMETTCNGNNVNNHPNIKPDGKNDRENTPSIITSDPKRPKIDFEEFSASKEKIYSKNR